MQLADEEPLFHYSRLAPKLASTLAPGATLTCATVHPRFLVRARSRATRRAPLRRPPSPAACHPFPPSDVCRQWARPQAACMCWS